MTNYPRQLSNLTKILSLINQEDNNLQSKVINHYVLKDLNVNLKINLVKEQIQEVLSDT